MKRVFIILLAAVFSLAMPACTSKKKLAEKEALEKKQQIELAKAKLNQLLTDTEMTLEDKEKELAEIKAMNLDDAEVDALILKVEKKLMNERKLKEQKEEEERLKNEKEALKTKHLSDTKNKLIGHFKEIAQASTVNDANSVIKEALKLFTNNQVPVLIVFNIKDGKKDYERPTTIARYLEFIKDQKKYSTKFENILFDDDGKITELELLK